MYKEKTALISVYHKDGIINFATDLEMMGWNILASGGTKKVLLRAGIRVTDVAELVGGEAILDHRVVTLSREVHAGLLARNIEKDLKELENLGLPFIDLVCVDLYPLEEEIKNLEATRESVIEKTDIGGPTMISSAAKGRRIVICKSEQRQKVIDWLDKGEPGREDFLNELAVEADTVVAKYRLLSAEYHSQGKTTGLIGEQVAECLYGENAGQTPAGLYSLDTDDPLALDKFVVVAGTSLSYNNDIDVERALQTMTHIAAGFEVNFGKVPKIAVAVKHGNACGAAYGNDTVTVLRKMIAGDPIALLGGVVMTNFIIGQKEADALYRQEDGSKRILDCIIASGFDEAAIDLLKRKTDKCRFVQNSALAYLTKESLDKSPRFRYVRGGFLEQPNYTFVLDLKTPFITRFGPKIDLEKEQDLIFACAIGSTSNSNTITLVKDQRLLGNGVGQQKRVDAAKLAVSRARGSGSSVKGAVAYSDSFFPHVDGPEFLIKKGIKVILTSNGSIVDEAVSDCCQKSGITLIWGPDKIIRGFYGH